MMRRKDNPHAFPACNEANVNGTMGMTLLDFFAGQALAALMSSTDALVAAGEISEASGATAASVIAGQCYEAAEAMLTEREKRA